MKPKIHHLGAVTFGLASLAVMTDSQPASAAIIATTGSAQVKDTAPASVRRNKWESNSKTRVFLEHSSLFLAQELTVKINDTGEKTAAADLTTSVFAAGTEVDSYLLHQDSKGSTSIRLKGTITFDENILGVMFTKGGLFASDSMAAAFKTQYPSEKQTMRRVELTGNSKDRFWISADLRTLKYDLRTSSSDFDQIRIFTTSFNSAPAPGCLGLLATAAITAVRRRRHP